MLGSTCLWKLRASVLLTPPARSLRRRKLSSEPEALVNWFKMLPIALARIGLEAGPLSQWLYAGLKEAGFAVELLETRHVRDAFKAMPVKTDRNDARGIAQLMRLGWFRPVHCKSVPAQETRAILTARKLVRGKLYDIEMSLRGILRGFGLKVGRTTKADTRWLTEDACLDLCFRRVFPERPFLVTLLSSTPALSTRWA